MKVKHFLSLCDLGPEAITWLVDKSLEIANGDSNGNKLLEGKIVGIFFKCPSTRTRSAFAAGALRLGARTIMYGPNDLQVVTGESIEDTGKVLSGFLDLLVVRTNRSISEMETLARQNNMAVVNAMSDSEHPSQAIADLVTIKQELGHLEGVHVLYLGEGNNTAAALALAMSQISQMSLTLAVPEDYGLPGAVLDQAQMFAAKSGGRIQQIHCMENLPENVDVVYTTRWQTMGEKKEDTSWIEKFNPFSVTPAVMSRVSKPCGTIFLHDLPAVRGSEVLDEVLDGPQSRAFLQARNKMTSAMAILQWCLA